MAKTATATVTRGGIDLDPIDRLEEKVKLLVNMVERMKADQSRAADDNQRLTREIESLRGRLASSDSLSAASALACSPIQPTSASTSSLGGRGFAFGGISPELSFSSTESQRSRFLRSEKSGDGSRGSLSERAAMNRAEL